MLPQREKDERLSDTELRILIAIYQGHEHFLQIRQATLISKPYLADLLDKLEHKGWIEHDVNNKAYLLHRDKEWGFPIAIERRIGSLAKWSTCILLVAKDIESLENEEDRRLSMAFLFTAYSTLVMADSIYAMAFAKGIKNKEKALNILKRTYYSVVPNTLSILANLARITKEIDEETLRTLANLYFEKSDEARKELNAIRLKAQAGRQRQRPPK